MRDCMIDLETLGTSSNAPILSIGACFFDIETGAIGQKFHEKIKVADALNYSRMSGDTFVWWMRQSDAARKKVITGTRASLEVLHDFCRFLGACDSKELRPWGNGASFDITILESSYARICGDHLHPADRRSPPWKFWNVRDCRTIKDLGEAAGYRWTEKLDGTAHDALDDAIFQARWTSFYWRNLTQKETTGELPVSDNVMGLLG